MKTEVFRATGRTGYVQVFRDDETGELSKERFGKPSPSEFKDAHAYFVEHQHDDFRTSDIPKPE